MVLTKEKILKGVNDPELVKIESLDGELPLRPLSKVEWNEIEQIEAKAYGKFEANETAQRGRRQMKKGKMETKGIIDLSKQNKAEMEGRTRALLLSMNNKHPAAEEWGEEEIKMLRYDVFEEIFQAVRKLSGVTNEKEIDDFPED